MIKYKFILIFYITLFSSIIGNSQVLINHSVVEQPPYTVGDTITIQYALANVSAQINVRSVWLRTQYSNKHIELIPNTTVFTNSQSWQTFSHQWVGYKFVPSSSVSISSLDGQYYSSSWDYVLDNNWNVNQLNFQSPSNVNNIVWATQKFIIKDQPDYLNIHALDMADLRNDAGQSIRPVSTNTSRLSLSNVTGVSSSTTIKIHSPSGYDISKHSVRIYNVNSVGEPDFQSIVKTTPISSSGQVFTTALQTGNKYYIEVLPVTNQSFLDDVITVTDSYKGFLQISDRGINNDQDYFNFPLEFLVGDVTGNNTFDKEDSYLLFAYISGLEIPSNYYITSESSANIKFMSGKVDGFLNGVFNNIVDITDQTHEFNFAYAWGGDLDFSHSTPIEVLSGNSSSRVMNDQQTMNVNFSSRIQNGKVIVDIKLDGTKLAGTQFKIKYDNQILSLDDVMFDTGNTVTNYKKIKNNIIRFGSIDTFGTAKVKPNASYRLTFSPNKQLTNSTGLVFIDFAEAVSDQGNKIKLIVQ